MNPAGPDRLLTIKDVAAILRISVRSVRKQLHADDPIPHIYVGPRCLRFHHEDVQRWLDTKNARTANQSAERMADELLLRMSVNRDRGTKRGMA